MREASWINALRRGGFIGLCVFTHDGRVSHESSGLVFVQGERWTGTRGFSLDLPHTAVCQVVPRSESEGTDISSLDPD